MLTSCWQVLSEVELRRISDACKQWANPSFACICKEKYGSIHEATRAIRSLIMWKFSTDPKPRPGGLDRGFVLHFHTWSPRTASFGLLYRNILLHQLHSVRLCFIGPLRRWKNNIHIMLQGRNREVSDFRRTYNICYTSEARAAELHEVKSTFLPSSMRHFSPDFSWKGRIIFDQFTNNYIKNDGAIKKERALRM